MKGYTGKIICVAPVLLALVCVTGCPNGPEPGEIAVPSPINLMLPREIRIHPFTKVEKADDGVHYIQVIAEARDSFDDATKAFGVFRFELYAFQETNTNSKGKLLQIWDVPVEDAKSNAIRWDPFARAYKFALKWDNPLPEGTAFVLVAVFSSRFTERMFDERIFDGKR